MSKGEAITLNMETLIDKAAKIRKNAYVPYSSFPVGAAVLTKGGKVYTGCNIENAAYPVSCCAERVAIFKAISNGETSFQAIAVIGDTERPIPPCGSCRQVMSEFFDKQTTIHLANLNGQTETLSMETLLPFSFQPKDLNSTN